MKNNEGKLFTFRVAIHEAAHTVAYFANGKRIDRVWLAPNFNKVRKGELFGACVGARTDDDPFASAVISLSGEAADRLICGAKPATEICELPWYRDAAGELKFRQGELSDLDPHRRASCYRQTQSYTPA
jgi:hypothetical protein